MSERLTPRQQMFLDEYLVSLSARDAARKAGYKQPHSQGPRLLQHPEVSAAIAAAQSVKARELHVTRDMVLRGLLREALGKEVSKDGTSRPLADTTSSARTMAWREVKKMLGFDAPERIEHSVRPVADLVLEAKMLVAEIEASDMIEAQEE